MSRGLLSSPSIVRSVRSYRIDILKRNTYVIQHHAINKRDHKMRPMIKTCVRRRRLHIDDEDDDDRDQNYLNNPPIRGIEIDAESK